MAVGCRAPLGVEGRNVRRKLGTAVKVVFDIPDNITLGDLTSAAGAIVDASTSYVDWELLASSETASGAVSPAGRVLLAIASQLPRSYTRSEPKDTSAEPPEDPPCSGPGYAHAPHGRCPGYTTDRT